MRCRKIWAIDSIISLPITWFTEAGMPARGILSLEYVSDAGAEAWDLRINLSMLTPAPGARVADDDLGGRVLHCAVAQ